MHKQGEIVLIPVPFSDLTATKKRPVLIISNNEFNARGEDVIVAAITSNIRGIEHEVVFDNADMMDGELKVVSCIRADKIYTLSKDIIVKTYVEIKEEKIEILKSKLNTIIK